MSEAPNNQTGGVDDADVTPEPRTGTGWVASFNNGSRIASTRLEKTVTRAKDQALGTQKGQRAKQQMDRASVAAGEKIRVAGSTDAGQKVARSTRAFGRVMSKVPGMGAVADSAAIRAGVDITTEAVKTSPGDPEKLLHLSLALRRRNEEMRQVRIAKTVMSPKALISRTMMRSAATMDTDEDQVPTEEKVLRAAYKRATARKKISPSDADNLHVLARIYFVQHHLDSARKLARLSLAAAPTHPADVYTTLGLIECDAGDLQAAEEYATLAIRFGSTMGHAVRATATASRELSIAEEARQSSQHQSLVSLADEVSYYGVVLDPGSMEIGKKLYHKHVKKASDLRSLPIPGIASSRASESDNRTTIPASQTPSPPLSDAVVSSTKAIDPEPHCHPPTPAASPLRPPGWHTDPLGRFDHRWWDGSNWTGHVARQGNTHLDPQETTTNP